MSSPGGRTTTAVWLGFLPLGCWALTSGLLSQNLYSPSVVLVRTPSYVAHLSSTLARCNVWISVSPLSAPPLGRCSTVTTTLASTPGLGSGVPPRTADPSGKRTVTLIGSPTLYSDWRSSR